MALFENLGDLIRKTRDPGKIAIIDLGGETPPRQFTYREIDEYAGGVARALIARGLSRGDRIGIFPPIAPNMLQPSLASCAPAWLRCR